MQEKRKETAQKKTQESMQDKMRRQCFVLGMIAVLLLGILTFRTMKKQGEALVVIQQEDAATSESLMARFRPRWLERMKTGQGATHEADTELLVLVNKDHCIPSSYEVELQWLKNGSCAVAKEMYASLSEMLTDGSVNGRAFVVASGYRDTETQRMLLEEDIQRSMDAYGMTWEQAYILETRETMPPGYSEHETGLAVDLVSLDYQVLDEEQEWTPENIWLRENCSRYGFILRYPKGKEEITGIDYEPWHFRYVGAEAAEAITQKGITLEEYLGEAGE